MDWYQWRATFEAVDGKSNGKKNQIWQTRVLVYRALADYQPAGANEPPAIAKLEQLAGVSHDTLYRHFQPKEGARDYRLVISNSLMTVAVLEAKEWSWEPYNTGLSAAEARAPLPRRQRIDAIIRTLATWAENHPGLSTWENYRAPMSVSLTLGQLLIDAGAEDPNLGDIIATMAIRRATTHPFESPLAVLNSLRPVVQDHIGTAAEDTDATSSAAIISELSRYARSVMHGAEPTTRAELLDVMNDLRALLENGPLT